MALNGMPHEQVLLHQLRANRCPTGKNPSVALEVSADPLRAQWGETNDVSLTLALLTKRSSYDTTAIVRSLTPRRSDLKA